jgi:Domain of unknown function (DUF4158)
LYQYLRKADLTMPRRSILTAASQESLIALRDSQDDLMRHYSSSESDLSIIKQHRGLPNRLGGQDLDTGVTQKADPIAFNQRDRAYLCRSDHTPQTAHLSGTD